MKITFLILTLFMVAGCAAKKVQSIRLNDYKTGLEIADNSEKSKPHIKNYCVEFSSNIPDTLFVRKFRSAKGDKPFFEFKADDLKNQYNEYKTCDENNIIQVSEIDLKFRWKGSMRLNNYRAKAHVKSEYYCGSDVVEIESYGESWLTKTGKMVRLGLVKKDSDAKLTSAAIILAFNNSVNDLGIKIFSESACDLMSK